MPVVQQQPITSQGIGGGGVLGASLLRSDPIVPATMASYMFVNNTRSCGRRQNMSSAKLGCAIDFQLRWLMEDDGISN